jgi:ferredoxin
LIKRGNILARNLHRWLGLFVGLQVVVWLASGLYMVIVDIDFIHGDPMVRNQQTAIVLPDPVLPGMSVLRSRYPDATRIDLKPVAGKALYTVITPGQRYLVNPDNGAVLSPLDEAYATAIAQYHFNSHAKILNTEFITHAAPMEIQRRSLPLWRVDFDDRFSTSFYIDPYSGELVTRRHQYWRIFDFMWMLHIMDYEERSDSHNLLIKTAEIAGLIFAISGIWLLFYSFGHRHSEKTGFHTVPLLKKLHRWVGVLIFIQVLIWLFSGLMLSQLDPEKVSGRQWVQQTPDTASAIAAENLSEPHQLSEDQLQDVVSISLSDKRGQAVFSLKRGAETTLVSASDGSLIVTGKQDARALAERDFSGSGEVISIEAGVAPDLETRNSVGDYWRVNFSERRNNYWRISDFFWMLHIMDYRGHEDINNSLVIFIALIAVWLGITGFALLFGSFSRHDFYFLNIFGKREYSVFTLIDPAENTSRRLRLRKGANLFLSLASHDIDVPSVCGGGGECGKCRVRFDAAEAPKANSIEQGLIPNRRLDKGYRLACQQEVGGGKTLHLPKGTLEREP